MGIGDAFIAIGLSVAAANRIILPRASFRNGRANAGSIGRAAHVAESATAKFTRLANICAAAHLPHVAITRLGRRIIRREVRRREMRLTLMLRGRARRRTGRQRD